MGGYANPLQTNNNETPGTSSNQFMAGMPSFANPGQSFAPYGSTPGGGNSPFPWAANSSGGPSQNPYQVPSSGTTITPTTSNTDSAGATNTGVSGIVTTGLQFPQEASDWEQYVNSQIGQGLTPYNLSTMLPDGTMTAPGQLSADLNPIMQQLMQFFQGKGGNAPGENTLTNIANNGISALPQWQSMIAAQQQNIGQQQANLKEQFAGMGDLAGSPFGTSMSNFNEQTTLDQNSLLAQLTQQNIGTQIGVDENMVSGASQFGNQVQSLDNQAIQNMYAEFQRTQPQNNPMNQFAAQMSGQYPPTTKTNTAFQDFMQIFGDVMGSGASYNGMTI